MEKREIAFWRAVGVRAWTDALNESPSRDRDDARQWLTGFSSDFRIVCQFADTDPECLLNQARKTEQEDWPAPRRAA